MRKARVLVHGKEAGWLYELLKGKTYRFTYDNDYTGHPVSLTMPTTQKIFEFDSFPSFFDGLLPEGVQLESLVRQRKIDKGDLFQQLVTVGRDLVGAVAIESRDDE